MHNAVLGDQDDDQCLPPAADQCLSPAVHEVEIEVKSEGSDEEVEVEEDD